MSCQSMLAIPGSPRTMIPTDKALSMRDSILRPVVSRSVRSLPRMRWSRLAAAALCAGLSASPIAQPSSAEPAAQPASAPTLGAVAEKPFDDSGLSGQGSTKPLTEPSAVSTPGPQQPGPVATRLLGSSATLGDLGLALMRGTEGPTGQRNRAVSPLSVSMALGLVHAGSTGASQLELASLMAPRVSGHAFWTHTLPGLLEAMSPPGVPAPWTAANRVWVTREMAAHLQPAYLQDVRQRLAADAAGFDAMQPETARREINGWLATATHGVIPELLPAGSLTSDTRSVLTSALHFKSPWEQSFDPANTAPRPFTLTDGSVVQVPTMLAEHAVHAGRIRGVIAMQLPFKGGEFSVVLALSEATRPLTEVVKALDGRWFAEASRQLEARQCRLSLPRFTIPSTAQDLKGALERLGVQAIFGEQADFSTMLGALGKDLRVSQVFHGASVTLDETGGEAAAATAVTVEVKSMRVQPPACAVDRPFAFAIVHRATGTTLFLGEVVNPGAD